MAVSSLLHFSLFLALSLSHPHKGQVTGYRTVCCQTAQSFCGFIFHRTGCCPGARRRWWVGRATRSCRQVQPGFQRLPELVVGAAAHFRGCCDPGLCSSFFDHVVKNAEEKMLEPWRTNPSHFSLFHLKFQNVTLESSL